MPLPIILGLAGLEATGVVGHCAKEVNDDYEYELNKINRSMEKLRDNTYEKTEISKREMESIIEKLFKQK